jgi:hypothetical protein
MQRPFSREHSGNAHSPNVESLQPGPNDKFKRFLQPFKHQPEITPVDEGRQIASSDEQFPKAESPIIENLEPNVKYARFTQSLKQDGEMVLSEERSQIRRRAEQDSNDLPIVSIDAAI